jgi:hypothetical protein
VYLAQTLSDAVRAVTLEEKLDTEIVGFVMVSRVRRVRRVSRLSRVSRVGLVGLLGHHS